MKESKFWSLHLLAGAFIFVLIAIHFAVMHLDELLGFEGVLSYENALLRGRQIFYLVVYTLLLALGLYHGLYGLRNTLFELGPGKPLEKVISYTLFIIGLVSFVYGEYAIIVAFRL